MRHPTPRRSWILTWPILLTLPLAGCDLSSLERKPSRFQQHQERLTALETRVAGLAVAPAAEPVFEPAPYIPPEPACVPVFRVVEC